MKINSYLEIDDSYPKIKYSANVNESWRFFTPFPDYLHVDFIKISSRYDINIYIHCLSIHFVILFIQN